MTRLPMRRQRARAVAALLALAIAAPGPALAGAWPQAEGQGQVISQITYYQTQSTGYDSQGRPVLNGLYRQIEFAPYVEYGLTPDWTIGGQPRLQSVTSSAGDLSQTSAGLAEVNLFARYAVWRGQTDVVSVQATAGTPGLATRLSPVVAYPNAEFELRGLFGHGFTLDNGMGGFVEADAAWRYRMGPAASELHVDVTAGLRPTPKLLLLAQNFNTLGLRDNAPGGADYSVVKLQLSAVYDLTSQWAVQLGAYSELAGRRVSLGNAGIVALWYRF